MKFRVKVECSICGTEVEAWVRGQRYDTFLWEIRESWAELPKGWKPLWKDNEERCCMVCPKC
jgi:hypothetical protein